jgi:type IV pilus assembly protein PilC
MAVFVFTGRTRAGQTITGEMEASNREAVVARLRSQQVIATAVRTKPRDITIPGFGNKVSEKEIVVFTRQFATMIDAGLPLVQCLEILASQQENKTFKKTLTEIRQSVEGGATFAAAWQPQGFQLPVRKFRRVSRRYSGHHPEPAGPYMEKAMSLRKIKSPIYPSPSSPVAVVVVIFLLVLNHPDLQAMFEGFGALHCRPIVLKPPHRPFYFLVGLPASWRCSSGVKWWTAPRRAGKRSTPSCSRRRCSVF